MISDIKKNSEINPPIEININLDSFMPSPSILYNYYEILKEYGYIPYKIRKKKIKKKKSKESSSQNFQLQLII